MIKCCKNCENRHPHCHNTCEEYLTEKAEWEKIKAEIRKVNSFHCFIIDEQRRYRKYAKHYFGEK